MPLKPFCTHTHVYIHVGTCNAVLSPSRYVSCRYCGSGRRYYIQRQWDAALQIYMYINHVYRTVYTHVHVWDLNGNPFHLAKCYPHWNIATAVVVVCNDLKDIIKNYLTKLRSLIQNMHHYLFIFLCLLLSFFNWKRDCHFLKRHLSRERQDLPEELGAFSLSEMEIYHSPACLFMKWS